MQEQDSTPPQQMSINRWLEQNRGLLFFILIIITVAGVVLFQLFRPEPEPILLTTPTPPSQPEPTPTPRPLRVYVSGAVNHPDVYTVPAESIIKDTILAAGGATDQADLDRINLAAPVANGEHIYVPHLGEETLPVDLSGQGNSGARVNINTADAATLETLPGIGPSIAQRIIDYRQANGPFATIEGIMEVSGIGPGTFAKIQEHITTR